MNSPLLFCVLAGVCFGTWPILARFGGMTPGWMSFLIGVGTMLATALGLNASTPGGKSAAIVVAAGAINGLGMLAFGKLIGWKGQDVSRLLPIVFAIMPVVTVLTALLFLHEPMTLKRGAGIVLAGIAIWFLN